MGGKSRPIKYLEAFEYYYSLGAKRTLPKVAEHFGYSVSLVNSWSQKYKWKDKADERDLANMKIVEEEDNKAYVESMRKYRKITEASITQYVNNLKNKKVAINTTKDYDRLVRLDLELSDRLGKNNLNKLALLAEKAGDSGLESILNKLLAEVDESLRDKKSVDDEDDNDFCDPDELV